MRHIYNRRAILGQFKREKEQKSVWIKMTSIRILWDDIVILCQFLDVKFFLLI